MKGATLDWMAPMIGAALDWMVAEAIVAVDPMLVPRAARVVSRVVGASLAADMTATRWGETAADQATSAVTNASLDA